jgi:hypothetical protein
MVLFLLVLLLFTPSHYLFLVGANTLHPTLWSYPSWCYYSPPSTCPILVGATFTWSYLVGVTTLHSHSPILVGYSTLLPPQGPIHVDVTTFHPETMTDRRMSERRMTERRMTEGRITKRRMTERRMTEGRMTEGKNDRM